MIDFAEIRKRVAMDNEINIPENDPALLVVKMNALVMEKYVEILNEQNEAQRQAFINAVKKNMADGVAESKKIAGRVVTDGADYVSKVCRDEIATALKEAKTEIVKDSIESKKAIEAAKRSGLLNGWLAASVTILALVVLIRVFV